MQYTVGNWSVENGNSVNSTTTYSLPIPDVNRSEFACRKHGEEEVQLANITSTGFDAVPEVVRFGRSKVANVYAGSDIPASAQSATKGGLRLLVEVRENLQAVNSVSGAEHQIPVRAWMVLQVPQSNLITADTVNFMLGRLLGTINMDLQSAGGFAHRFLSMARGDLDPDVA